MSFREVKGVCPYPHHCHLSESIDKRPQNCNCNTARWSVLAGEGGGGGTACPPKICIVMCHNSLVFACMHVHDAGLSSDLMEAACMASTN